MPKIAAPLPLLQQALSRVNDVVLITEAEPMALPGPRIVFVNEAFERMTGYTAEEVYGQTPRVLHGPRTDRQILHRLGESMRRWESTRVTVTNYRKNGVPFDVEFDVTPIADETGWFTHWVSIQRDITNSSVAGEVILRASTVEELAAGVCRELHEYTAADCVLWCMRTVGQPWHVIGEGSSDLRDPDQLPPSDTVVAEPLPVTGLEIVLLVRRDGSSFEPAERELVSAVASRCAPAAERLFAVAQRERMSVALRQAERLEAIGRLAGGIAHDFNNLLTVVVGNLEYLQSVVPATAETLPLFAEINGASLRARDLVQHLLAFGRKRNLTREPFAVDAAISGAVALLERATADVLTTTTAVEAPAPVAIGDPAMLEQILVNVVMNARDAIAATSRVHRGEVRIVGARAQLTAGGTDRIGTSLPPGRYVAIDIIDDGPGMPEEVRTRAFDPFFTTKPVGAGSGLGLSSAYGAAVMMGGTIEIFGADPQGTHVRILLPAA